MVISLLLNKPYCLLQTLPIANYSGQSFCLYSMKNLKYCSNSWFIHSICLSVCEWNAVDNLISIPNILFNFLVSSTANCGPLLLITLSGNLCNFHMLSLNNLANPSANILSVVATKCVIFDNLSHTTSIVFFPATNGNLVIKSTIRCVYIFSNTSFTINFPAGVSI